MRGRQISVRRPLMHINGSLKRRVERNFYDLTKVDAGGFSAVLGWGRGLLPPIGYARVSTEDRLLRTSWMSWTLQATPISSRSTPLTATVATPSWPNLGRLSDQVECSTMRAA